MWLSLQQAAERLGKSVRQIRYLIQTGALPATKSGGRWRIAAGDLPLSAPQKAAVELERLPSCN
jgi:excisionase family DNA binding protein